MALIVENGKYPDGANSYVSLEFADNYLVPRGLWKETPVKFPDVLAIPVEPDITPPVEPEPEPAPQEVLPDVDGIPDADVIADKEAAIIRAFDWLNVLKWKGRKHCWEQIQAWPRIEVPEPGSTSGDFLDPAYIPRAVLYAQCELAALIHNGSEILSPVEHGGRIKSVSDSITNEVDILSETKSHSVTYADNAPVEAWLPTVYPLLRDFLEELPGQVKNGFQSFKFQPCGG